MLDDQVLGISKDLVFDRICSLITGIAPTNMIAEINVKRWPVPITGDGSENFSQVPFGQVCL